MTSLPSSAAVFASGNIGATLPHPAFVQLQGALCVRARPPGQARVLPSAERRGGRGPRLAVAGEAVGAQLRTQRDQRGEVAHGLDGARVGDPDEPVRVEVVAEQERGVGVGGLEQARAPVVEQVALVDRLEAERVSLLGQRREDRLALRLLAERLTPQATLVRGLASDRVPEVGRYSPPASSFVQ